MSAAVVPGAVSENGAPNGIAKKYTPIPPVLPPVREALVQFDGLIANVGYVDVGPADGGVIIAVHGAMGGLNGLVELFEPLANAGYRVLAPEFPGFGHSFMIGEGKFDETTTSRAHLVQAFMAKVKVSSAMAVLGHSMGTATAFRLAAKTDLFKAVIYLSGIGLKPHKSLRPYCAVHVMACLLECRCTRSFCSRFLISSYRMRGFEINTEDGLVSATLGAARIGFSDYMEAAHDVQIKGLPILMAFTQNDRLVEWQIPHELAKFCGAPDFNIAWFDGDENVKKDLSAGEAVLYPRVLIFERGGHFVHRSHTQLVCGAIIQLMEYLAGRETNDDTSWVARLMARFR